MIPDANIILYAADSTSPRFEPARNWLEGMAKGVEELGLPWIVALAFLRISTSPRVFARPYSIDEALSWLENLRSHPMLRELAPGAAHFGILKHLLLAVGSAGNLTSDAHLAALALEHDATIVTGDRDFQRFPGVKTKLLF